jgi:hypothetical protein
MPLNEPSDPFLTASLGATQPAAVLQALLLHWLLLPQLALAGLPALPEPLLLQLLQEVVAALSSRQLQLTARWSEVWRLTQLQPPTAAVAGDSVATASATAEAAGQVFDVHAPTFESSVASGAWGGVSGISASHVAHVISCVADALMPVPANTAATAVGSDGQQGCQQHQRQLSQGSAAAAAEARAVTKALLLGQEPMQPLLLLVMQQVLLLQPASEVGSDRSSNGGAATAARQLQLLQLLLEAGSSSPLRVMSLAEVIDNSFSSVFKRSSGSSSSGWGDASSIEQQHLLLHAAVDVLAILPAQQLQHELQQLLELQADRSSSNKQLFSQPVYRLFISLAERADPAQAAVLLAVLAMPAWAAVWATFVSPTAGAFCWTRQQLAAALVHAAAAEVQQKTEGMLWGVRKAAGSSVSASSSGSSGWQKLEAAWAVVCAHFALGDVKQELQNHFKSSSSSSSSSSSYVPGVPFIGDGYDQAVDTSAESAAAAAAGPAAFAGSLSTFVEEVVLQLPPAAAACHVAALVEVLPVDAFARLAVQLLPPTAFGTAASTADAAAPLAGLQKALLRLYSSIANLPDAATAVQLLAAAAPQLPIDRLPAFLVAGYEVCEGLQRMRWLPGAAGIGATAGYDVGWEGANEVKDAHYNTGYAWNNAWTMSNRGGGDGAVALGAQEHFELLVAAAAPGRDSAALQQMLAVLVQQLPVGLAQLAVDVLGGGVSDAAFVAAKAMLQQRKQLSSASTAGAGGNAASTGFESQVVWQMGQNDAAAADNTSKTAAAVARWGVETHVDAAAAAAASGFAADQVLVREVVQLVEAIPAAVPAGSFPMDAMQVRGLVYIYLSMFTKP